MAAKEMQSLRINQESLDRLNTLAQKQGRTRADVLRRCLARGLTAEEADQAKIDRLRR